MTKAHCGASPAMVGLLVLLAVVSLVPSAQAHGAAPLRETDTRVLVDDDGAATFGGCTATPAGNECAPDQDTGALDLLSLDMRVARDAARGDSLVVRVAVQAEVDSMPGRTLTVELTAKDKPLSFTIQGDGVGPYTSKEFDRVRGPFPIGDGHPKAIEGWIALSKLGLAPKDVISDIHATSLLGTAKGDIMPGTWYTAQGQQTPVPYLAKSDDVDPMDASALIGGCASPSTDPGQGLCNPDPGTFNVTNALAVFDAEPTQGEVLAGSSISIRFSGRLAALGQFVNLTVTGSDGVTAQLDVNGVSLQPGAPRMVRVGPITATKAGTVSVLAVSDLGDSMNITIPVKAPAPPTTAPSSGAGPGSPTPPASTSGKSSPAPAAWTLLAPLAGAGMTKLRRARRTPASRGTAPQAGPQTGCPGRNHETAPAPVGRSMHNAQESPEPTRPMLRRAAPPVALVCTLLAALAVVPVGQAHAAGGPVDGWTRLLADYSDDCGGDGITTKCSGSHDLLALDVREAYVGNGPVVQFRFWLDAGSSGATTDTLVFNANGARSYSITSSDNQHFSGTFDSVTDAKPSGDGSRFVVDATLSYTTLGASVGTTLSGFAKNGALLSKHGSTSGDKMPGTFSTPLGDGPAPPADDDCGCPYQVDSYSLKGTQTYLHASASPDSVSVAETREVLVTIDLDNAFQHTPQTATLRATGGDGVSLQFHAVSGDSEFSDTATLDVAAGASATEHLYVKGLTAGASGTAKVTIDTDQGGRTELSIPYSVTDKPTDGGDETTQPPPSSTHKASAAGAELIPLLALAAMALIASRRR